MNVNRAIRQMSQAGYSIKYEPGSTLQGLKPESQTIRVVWNHRDEVIAITVGNQPYRNIERAIREADQ